jgi:sugar lactone lactonase YvrE
MSYRAELFVDSRSKHGEGALWHPDRQSLFWVDIYGKLVLEADLDGTIVNRFSFDNNPTALGIVDHDTLAVAQSGSLLKLDLKTGTKTLLAKIEGDKPGNRSNDGRVDPSGGFWIGTMGRKAERGVGAVYQYRAGRLVTVLANQSIPNSICFSPDGQTVYYTDAGAKIVQAALNPETGLPEGTWSDFAMSPEGKGAADGSVVDSEGYLWSARWQGSRVIRFAPDGSIDREVEVPVSRVSCPAFGGPDLKTLFLTTSQEGITADEAAAQPHAGSVFKIEVDVPGQPEHRVKL